MFDAQAAKQFREMLPDFSFAKPSNLSALPDLFAEYFEYYAFFETLKEFDGDYHFGKFQASFGGRASSVALHYWRHPSARGTAFVVHGLFDHVGIYQTLVRYLVGQRYSVVAFDLPGHGLSAGAPTEVKHFADYSEVLAAIVAAFADGAGQRPFHALGQSTGAAVIMGDIFSRQTTGARQPFEKFVFLGPLIRPVRWRIGRLTLKLFGRFMQSIMRDMSSANSHDLEFHNFLRHHDPLQSRRLAVSWVTALDEWIAICRGAPPTPIQLLVVQGTKDGVVDWRRNIPELTRLFPNLQINYVEGAMHHLVNEAQPWRQAIFASVGQFLKQKPMV